MIQGMSSRFDPWALNQDDRIGSTTGNGKLQQGEAAPIGQF
jgi:hypothetical protein